MQTSSNAALLYKDKKPKGKALRKAQDMEQSELFQAFGDKSLARGTEDDTPTLHLDLAQVDTLEGLLMTPNPSKVQPLPKATALRYPLHASTEDMLHTPAMDPLFLSAKEDKRSGGNNSLVLSKNAETLDGLLYKVRKAVNYNIAATAALQQGLGRIMLALEEESHDPAILKSVLSEAFEASMDCLDQAGRAAAINQHARRLNIIKDVGLSGSSYESDLTHLPLDPKWLFGAELNDITERIKARKSAAGTICSSSKKNSGKQRYHHHHSSGERDSGNREGGVQSSFKHKQTSNRNRQTPYANKPKSTQGSGHQSTWSSQPFRQGAGATSGKYGQSSPAFTSQAKNWGGQGGSR
jgi:hypothetical protein